MLMILTVPERASDVLERLNRWFATHARLLGVLLSTAVGLFLVGRGLLGLLR